MTKSRLLCFLTIKRCNYLSFAFNNQKNLLDIFTFNLKEKLEYIIIVIVLVTTLPVIIKFVFGKKEDLSKKYEDQDFE
ncbi:hypothetical protein [Chryseobacterium sp. KLBC 52]|uniref:hypothetical protein n=1 Tax=Chryseobacterium sp. KLBC 52 TaxID=1862702 RepID=UPI001E351900|nr:hypothetical protein [Chryseobacterium sp. KLBC 52]